MAFQPSPSAQQLDRMLQEHSENSCTAQAAAMGMSPARLIACPHADMLLSLVGLVQPKAHLVDRSVEMQWWWCDLVMRGSTDAQMISGCTIAALGQAPEKPPFPVAAAVLWIGGRRYAITWKPGKPWKRFEANWPEKLQDITPA